jgi:hypothetical protein
MWCYGLILKWMSVYIAVVFSEMPSFKAALTAAKNNSQLQVTGFDGVRGTCWQNYPRYSICKQQAWSEFKRIYGAAIELLVQAGYDPTTVDT